jgi:hypothetical protein
METEKKPEETEQEKKLDPNPNNYVYCKNCDIFYNKQLKEKANAERESLTKDKEDMLSFVISLYVHSCPMCAMQVSASAKSMSRSIEAEHPHMRDRDLHILVE